MPNTASSTTAIMEEIRRTPRKGSYSGVYPTKCMDDPQAVKTLTRTARKQKLAALGEVPPVHSNALAKQHQPAPASQELIDGFCTLVKDAGFAICTVRHAKKAATTLVETARASTGRREPHITDLVQRDVFTQAVQTLRATRSADRRLPMLVHFVTYLHTGRLVERTAIPQCEEIRRLYQASVPQRPRAKHISLDPAKDHPLAQAYIRELDARNAGWQKRAKYAFRRFCSWLAEQPAFDAENVTAVDVTRVKAENLLAYYHHLDDQVVSGRMARGTFRLRIQALRRWFEYLYLNGYIYSDPTVTLPVVKGREKAPHCIISMDEARRYLDSVMRQSRNPLQDMAIFACLSGLGLRPSEAIRLRVADLDRAAAALRVLGKGNKERLVPLPGPVLLSLERHLAARMNPAGEEPLFTGMRGGPLGYESLRIRFHTFQKVAAIDRAVGGPHVFRHYFITQNLLAGADLEDLAAVVGHGNIRSMESYFHTTLDGLRAAVLRAYGGKEGTK